MEIADLINKFKGIQVYALVGESGTGKSFKAKLLAQKYGINAIIDDGLLIVDDKIIGGKSAKSEKTYMGAVRVAVFDDKEQEYHFACGKFFAEKQIRSSRSEGNETCAEYYKLRSD